MCVCVCVCVCVCCVCLCVRVCAGSACACIVYCRMRSVCVCVWTAVQLGPVAEGAASNTSLSDNPAAPHDSCYSTPPPPACGVRRGCRKALCCAAPSSWRRHPSPRPPAPRLGHALLTCSILPLWPPSTGPLLREPSPTPSSGLWIGPRCTGSPAAAFGAPGACRRIATRDAQRRPRAAPVGGLLRPQS